MFKNLQRRNKRGQSTIEYIIVVTGVIAVLIIFFGKTGPFATALNGTFGQAANGMNKAAGKLATPSGMK